MTTAINPQTAKPETSQHTEANQDEDRRLRNRYFMSGYDPVFLEQLYHFNPFRLRHRQDWESLLQFWGRFFTVLGFVFKIMYYGWYDRQVWTCIGAEDIEREQSLRRREHARWMTDKLLELGPTFIKVGQSISTRVDLIRREYIEELSKLQDKVPAFSTAEALRIIEEELGDSPEKLFESFDVKPLAAASLGQVHRARLKTGETGEAGAEIVLKVQRPNLMQTFCLDLVILRKFARFFQKNTELGRGREWVQIVDEFGRTLFEEIDYIQEGRNADVFRKSFTGNPHIHIPDVYWRYTSRRVIAFEYAPGIKINDIRTLELRGFDRESLSTHCVQAFFQQILMDGFYHADPHPGNIAVREDGVLILYDFGMVGRIPEKTRLLIVDAFLNIIHKKPDHILNNLIELDMLAHTADTDVIRQVIEWALDHYYDVPHDQLNFEYLTDELSELMYAHPFKLPANFTFMIRSLITLEGVATFLYPPIHFMAIAVDYARGFIGETFNLNFLLKKGRELLGSSGLGGGSPSSQKYPARVRLHSEEWTPLARYLKAGFILMGMGQVMTLFLVVILLAQSSSKGNLWALVTLIAIVTLYGLVVMTALFFLPAARKQVRFEPFVSKSAPNRENQKNARK